MPRPKLSEVEKPVEMKLKMTKKNAEKLAKTATDTKQNRTKILNNLIENMDTSMKIFEALHYIQSRENIFIEVAQLAQNLKNQQAEMVLMFDEIKKQIRDYKNKNTEVQNSLVSHLAKTEKILEEVKNKKIWEMIK